MMISNNGILRRIPVIL